MEGRADQFIESYTRSSICILIPEDTVNTGGEKQIGILNLNIIFFSAPERSEKTKK